MIDLQTFYLVQPLVVCFRIAEVFKYDEYLLQNNSTKLDVSNVSNVYDTSEELLEYLTIKEVLTYTPAIDEAIETCWVRTNHSFALDEYALDDCINIFYVERFTVSNKLCYWFEYKDWRKGFQVKCFPMTCIELLLHVTKYYSCTTGLGAISIHPILVSYLQLILTRHCLAEWIQFTT